MLSTLISIGADADLAGASTAWLTAAGGALWSLRLAATQGQLGAMIAGAAPGRLRGAAFGIYDVALGAATFSASAADGVLWMLDGPVMTFGASVCLAAVAALMLLFQQLPKVAHARS